MSTAMRPFSLRFVDRNLEKAYLEDAFSDYARPLRLALIVGTALYGGFVWVDRYVFGEFHEEILVNRSAICTLALGLTALTTTASFSRWARHYMALLHVAVGFGAIHMSIQSPVYEGGLYAALAFFPLLARAQFQFSMNVNAFMLIVYGYIRARPDGLAPVLVDVSMLFAALVVFGLGAYVKERAARAGFLQKRALAAARDRALEANRAKSTFLAKMSHELRTPLNAVIGYGEMLQEDLRDAGQQQHVDDLEKIVGSGRHLLGLIDDILDLSKIEAGKIEIASEPFSVGDLVDGVATTIAPMVHRNGNQLEHAVADDVGTMTSDPTRVRQILFNLLSNAAKFTKDGTIRVAVARRSHGDAEHIVFTVSDDGIGMTDTQLERVFEAFSQAEASTTRDFGGTGLGLTITKHFCEMLGGTISVKSEPQRGTEFTVRLAANLGTATPN